MLLSGSATICTMPSWSRRSMKHRPPRLRATSAQPQSVTVWPTRASSMRPQKWVRMETPGGTFDPAGAGSFLQRPRLGAAPVVSRKDGILTAAAPYLLPSCERKRRTPRRGIPTIKKGSHEDTVETAARGVVPAGPVRARHGAVPDPGLCPGRPAQPVLQRPGPGHQPGIPGAVRRPAHRRRPAAVLYGPGEPLQLALQRHQARYRHVPAGFVRSGPGPGPLSQPGRHDPLREPRQAQPHLQYPVAWQLAAGTAVVEYQLRRRP